MQVSTERFGPVEINPEEIYDFPLGIIGFPEYHKYGIVRDPKLLPFTWLQSFEEPRLCFFVVEPFSLFPDYEIEVKLDGVLRRDVGDPENLIVLCICTIAQDFRDSTANLLAPLIVNRAKQVGYQVVMEESRYHTRHRLFAPPPESEPKSAGESGIQTSSAG